VTSKLQEHIDKEEKL